MIARMIQPILRDFLMGMSSAPESDRSVITALRKRFQTADLTA